jgi:ribosomal silencing factor RsfS
MSLKHSKIKNNGLIFNILTQKMVVETLNNKKGNALNIISKFYKPDTNLVKELNLYTELNKQSVDNPTELVEFVLSLKKTINVDKLSKEKYQLISEIRKNYNLEEFFKTRCDNYRHYASIYKLLEYSGIEDPSGYLQIKKTILEHITTPLEKISDDVLILETETKEIRNLTLCVLIEQFNEKYKSINSRQRLVLSEYLNQDTNSKEFKEFIITEIAFINNQLNKFCRKSADEILKIKLNEVVNLTDKIITANYVKDEHVSAIIKFHELIQHINNN